MASKAMILLVLFFIAAWPYFFWKKLKMLKTKIKKILDFLEIWYIILWYALKSTISASAIRLMPFSPQGGENMINYEVMFIIDAALEDAQKEATIETVKEIIAAEGEVSNVDIWGVRKLAYPIQKKNEGYYVVVEFKAPADLPKELDRRLKISDNVIRHMIINKEEK